MLLDIFQWIEIRVLLKNKILEFLSFVFKNYYTLFVVKWGSGMQKIENFIIIGDFLNKKLLDKQERQK